MALTKVQPEMMQQLTPAIMPTGSVIQTVYVETGDDDVFTTSTSFTDLASATITPISTTSKILIKWSGVYQVYGNIATTTANAYMQILRNATVLNGSNSEFNGSTPLVNNAGVMQASSAINWIDSPATTSAITYKIQHKASSGARVGVVQNNTIILLEIKG